jgi:rhodanese-related sulfurtransferase
MPELWVLAASLAFELGWEDFDEKKSLIEAQVPEDWEVYLEEDPFEAHRKNGKPDAIVIDVGTIGGQYPQPEIGSRHAMALLHKYQSATLFVCSAVGGYADEVIEYLKDAGYAPVWISEDILNWRETFIEYGLFKEEE